MTTPASQMTWISDHPDGAHLRIRVIPRAPRNIIEGVLGDALKIRLQAPPVDGEANQALIRLLADKLGVSRSALHLAAGSTGRNKLVIVAGLCAGTICQRLTG